MPVLKEKGLNTHYLVGFRYFEELGDFLKEQVSDYAAEDEALRPVQVSPPRAKSVKKKTVNQLSRSPPKPNSPPRGQTPQRGEATTPGAHAVRVSPLRGWHDPDAIRPCPLDGHRHELGDCAEFLSMNPRDRRVTAKYKNCYTCLRPLWKCREGSRSTLCSQEEAFLPLICRQCTDSVKGRKLSGMNILMCGYKEHTKPSLDHLADLLHQMIGYDKGNKGGLVLSCMGLPCPNPLVSQVSKSRTPTLEPESFIMLHKQCLIVFKCALIILNSVNIF